MTDPDQALAVALTLNVAHYLDLQAAKLDRILVQRARPKSDFRVLKTIPGVGDTLGMTIMYETGNIHRFPSVGDYASYCRCVPTDRRSNNKSKGKGNPRNGNPYLSWAFSEAAFFAQRFCKQARRFYDRKLSSSGSQKLATRALAAKLARASYFMLRDQETFDPKLLFGS